MILAALKDWYDRASRREDGPPPFGYSEQAVVGVINLRDDGTVAGLTDLRGISSGKGKPVAGRLVVPQPPKRTVAIAAGFLCDVAGYLLGYDAKGKPERAQEQFEAAAALHRKVLAGVDHPTARALVVFFDRWNTVDADTLFEGQADELKTGWLVFRRAADRCYAHDVPELRSAWERVAGSDEGGPRGQCLVTGEHDVSLPMIHPSIKGVPGAQSSGAALVSFNLPAFTSYGKEQNLNAPIGAAAAFAYTSALNHMLKRGGQNCRIGDMSVVVWADTDTPAEGLLPALLSGMVLDDDESVAGQVRGRLESVARGKWDTEPVFSNAERIHFFVLGLAPNAARLQIRFFLTDTLAALLSRVQEHCRDLLFQEPGHGGVVPSFWALVNELLPRDGDGKTRKNESDKKKLDKLAGDLLRTVLGGYDYPETVLPLLLNRLRTDGHLTRGRIGFVKACLNRRARRHDSSIQEIPMDLDETSNEPGYVLGRLFAALESLQVMTREARSDSPTIKDRFAAAASVTPRAVFPYLLGLSQAHLKKARRDKPGIAHRRGQDIEGLAARLSGSEGFPSQLDLRQQGLFFIGYYQQRQAFFRKGEGAPQSDNEADTIDTDNSSEE